jgi:hypothetical protein
MKYSAYKQSGISDFYHNFDSTKFQITYNSLVTSTDGYRDKVLSQINNLFYYWHRHRVVLDIPILITRGVFQKNLMIAQEQILQELIVWERGSDAKSHHY